MKLIKKSTNDFAPDRIVCTDKQGIELATVYTDTRVRFTSSELSVHEVNQIKTIAENFKLFFDNLQ